MKQAVLFNIHFVLYNFFPVLSKPAGSLKNTKAWAFQRHTLNPVFYRDFGQLRKA